MTVVAYYYQVNDRYDAKRLQTTCKWDETQCKWVCLHCWAPPNTFYIVTGHDHTDDSIWWCPCREKQDGPL